MLWSSEGMGLSALFMLISVCFEFDSVIYCIFCSFWFLFVYCWWFMVVLRFEDCLTSFPLIFCLMEFFSFFYNTCFGEKTFKTNFFSSFSSKKEIIFKSFYFCSPLRIHSLACYLYVRETSPTMIIPETNNIV